MTDLKFIVIQMYWFLLQLCYAVCPAELYISVYILFCLS